MPTRRQILQQAICAPLSLCANSSKDAQIFAAPDCLSQESAAGFRSVLEAHAPRNLIVLCGIAYPSFALGLRRYALNGGWVLWEAPLRSSHSPNPFGITMEPAIAASADHLYIRYSRPRPTLTRSFSWITPLRCQQHEALAHYGVIPVALKCRLSRGGIIVLGSMLGPNLYAGETQAHSVARTLISEI